MDGFQNFPWKIFWFPFQHFNVLPIDDSLYIGESGRKLEKRLAEHKSKAASSKSAIRKHIESSNGHNI